MIWGIYYLFNLKFKHYTKIPRISLATAVDGMNISILCYDVTAAGPMYAGTAGLWCSVTSAANRLIGEVVQSRRRSLLGPSPS